LQLCLQGGRHCFKVKGKTIGAVIRRRRIRLAHATNPKRKNPAGETISQKQRGGAKPLPFAFAAASRDLFPELRLKVQLVHRLNQTTDVVAEYLAQRFVDLRRAGLAPKAIPELRLYQHEG
jgi:hypothetical protein